MYLEGNKKQIWYSLTYLEVLKFEQGSGSFFERQTRTSKLIDMHVFRGFKQTSKVYFVFLEGKLQEYRYVSCIYKFKCHKTVERRYLATRKQQARYRWCF